MLRPGSWRTTGRVQNHHPATASAATAEQAPNQRATLAASAARVGEAVGRVGLDEGCAGGVRVPVFRFWRGTQRTS
jgi:hypothetical protein